LVGESGRERGWGRERVRGRREREREERADSVIADEWYPAVAVIWPSLQTGPLWTRHSTEGVGWVTDYQILVAGTTAVTHAGLAVL